MIYSLFNVAIASQHVTDVHLVQSWFNFDRENQNISSADAADAVSYPSFSIKENLHPHLDFMVHLILLIIYSMVFISCFLSVMSVQQSKPVLSYPWIICTTASVVIDVVFDLWLLLKVNFTPQCSFIFALEFIFVMLQVYSIYCIFTFIDGLKSTECIMTQNHTSRQTEIILREFSLSRISEECTDQILRECAGSNGNSKDKILFCLFDKESVRQPGAKEKKVFV